MNGLHARSQHRFPRNPDESRHLGVGVGNLAIPPDHHDRGVAGVDQRFQLVALALHGRMLARQGLPLLRDRAQERRVVERGLDLPAQHDRPVEILLRVVPLLFVPEIQRADHAVADVQRHDHRRDAPSLLQQYALRARKPVHPDGASCADCLPRQPLVDGEDGLAR